MASHRFNLNNKVNKDGLDLIVSHISYKNELGKYAKLVVGTQIHVKPENWLQKKQLIGNGDYLKDDKNDILKNKRSEMEALLIKARKLGVEENGIFKHWFKDSAIQIETENADLPWQDKAVWKDWDDYLFANKNSWTASSYKSKLVERNRFKEFEEFNKHPLTWGSITLVFYNRFVNWCYDRKKYKNSNVGRLIKGLKSMMEWSFNNERHKNLVYKRKDFAKPIYMRSKIYFLPEELKQFYNLELTSTWESKVRDALCFSCFTGLRYSDIKLATKANVQNGWLKIITQKTSEEIAVPLIPEALEILKKYEHLPISQLIPVPTDQKCNEAIHKVLKDHGFNREIEMIDIVRKEKIRTFKPLHEVFSFHCGKKTFITLFKRFGGDTNVVMSLTGNKDEKVIRNTYEDIGTKLKTDQMTKVWANWRVSSEDEY